MVGIILNGDSVHVCAHTCMHVHLYVTKTSISRINTYTYRPYLKHLKKGQNKTIGPVLINCAMTYNLKMLTQPVNEGRISKIHLRVKS